MKRILSTLLAGGAALILMSGCNLPWDSSTPSAHIACVDTFVASWTSPTADVWDCLTVKEQASLFYNNGWNDNAAMIKALQKDKGDGITYQVTYFVHNPQTVCTKDAQGNQTCSIVYLVYVVPVLLPSTPGGDTFYGRGVGFALTVVGGKIDAIG